MTTPPSILIIAIGNPSRGDDAIGPLMIERLEALDLPGIELLTDFQLQVEFALDLQGRTEIVFVDAAASGPAPFTFEAVEPAQDTSYSSHELSPAAVLHAYEKLFGPAPRARVLAVRGYAFGLGTPLSPAAVANLNAATRRLLDHLRGA